MVEWQEIYIAACLRASKEIAVGEDLTSRIIVAARKAIKHTV